MAVGRPSISISVSLRTLAQQAQAHYARAIQAQRDGNWAEYGDELRQVGEVLEQLQGMGSQN